MKRIISIILFLIFVVSSLAFQPITADALNTVWKKEYYKDKFGDPTESYYIINENRFAGVYNNDSVEDGSLEASIVVDVDGVYIILYEDGKRVKYPGQYLIDIKLSDGEVSSFIGQLETESNRILLEAPDSETLLIDALSLSEVVSFYIEQTDIQSTYVFKATSDNFASIYEEEIEAPVKEPIYQDGLQFLKNNDPESSYLVFSNLGNYKDSQKRANDLLDKLGGPSGLFFKGADYYLGTNNKKVDYDKAIGLLEKSAELGNSGSTWMLGYMYEHGDGFEQDYYKAIEWYEKAADLGEGDALIKLGNIYYKGEGIETDYTEAFKWYSKAADEEIADAYFVLGVMYEHGQGVGQDYDKAIEWYIKAADAGDVHAMYNLGHVHISDESGHKDNKESFYWYKRAADQNFPEAMEVVGLMYKVGIGTEKDYSEAFKWFSKAADQGSSFALEQIQDLVDKNYIDAELADPWLK